MPATSVGEELFTLNVQSGALVYEVDGNTIAVAIPAPQPLNADAWYVTLFDPFGRGDAPGAVAVSEDAARDLAALFARTTARAVNR